MAPSLRTSSAWPAASFATDHASPVGRTCTSSRCFETSIPTNTVSLLEEGLSAQPCLADASLPLGQLFGLVGEKEGAATTTWRRSLRPGCRERPAAPGA